MRHFANASIDALHDYPFQRLRATLDGLPIAPGLKPIPLSLGEPKHLAPDFVVSHMQNPEAIRESLGSYPATRGNDELRGAIANWLQKRFGLPSEAVSADQHVLPVNGTREALFSIAHCLLGSSERDRSPGLVVVPNPFYQIYEGAALLCGAQLRYVDAHQGNNYLPDYTQLSEQELARCQLLYLCNPGNPSGAVAPVDYLQELLALAHKHDFVIIADECYSEIYPVEAAPPAGMLEASALAGNTDFERVLVFHSLSKRSNLPGLRSGFVAGDSALINRYLKYRTYHGCAMPVLHQQVSAAAWSDETHVIENRAIYEQKYQTVVPILNQVLDVHRPAGGFYLWPELSPEHHGVDDLQLAKRFYTQAAVTVLPGRYLARPGVSGKNPGENHVRMALVAPIDECIAAAERISKLI